MARVVVQSASSNSFPQDKKHRDFLGYVLEYLRISSNLTSCGGKIIPQDSERKFLVESLGFTFFALERIFNAGSVKWIERKSVTVKGANFRAQASLTTSDDATEFFTDTSALKAVNEDRNFDIVVVGASGDVVLMEVSGPPTTPETSVHPQNDARKLETEAKKLLRGQLRRFASAPAALAAELKVLTVQVITTRLTVPSVNRTTNHRNRRGIFVRGPFRQK
ncbi:hypothetical protein BC832DRAFT_545574 [Gaertneriomyces semiglobifer]|nr:hypothetical protein BC832DRAFT_545574 [Gaertneriomyces semiglobifer]